VLWQDATWSTKRRAGVIERRRVAEAMPERAATVVAPPARRRRRLVQRSLLVGAVDDPAEHEADRVAAEVIARMTAGSPVLSGLGAARSAMRIRRTASQDVNHGPEGGAIDPAVAQRIAARRGAGASLPEPTRVSFEQAFGADLSAVRIHVGGEADQLNRSLNARAFTAGSDIFFAAGAYAPGSTEGRRVLAHELTHTIQQGGVGEVARSATAGTPQLVQRHSSFEHLMLGNVKPADLAKVGAWQDAIAQTVPTRTGVSKKVLGSGGGQQAATVNVDLGSQQLSISKADILHVLLQEMRRLKDWQKDPP
jgi:hypothetical protein